MRTLAALLLFVSATASAQVLARAGGGLVVAHDGRLDAFDAGGQRMISSVRSVSRPSKIIVSGDHIAVIDMFASEVALVRGRVATIVKTGESPVDGVFAGDDLFIVSRDARTLERIRSDGSIVRLDLDPDPAFVRGAKGFLYVYSRLTGVVQEISPSTFAVTRRATIGAFASDFEIDGNTGYLLYPREAKLRAFSLSTMKVASEVRVGAVPVDLAIVGARNPISPKRIAIADASAKRIWITEGLQSITGAFTRGFIRGLLGLGLFSPAHSDFPTGVDRIVTHGGTIAAYDSATGALYRVRGSKIVAIAKGVGPHTFTATADGVATWQNGAIRVIR